MKRRLTVAMVMVAIFSISSPAIADINTFLAQDAIAIEHLLEGSKMEKEGLLRQKQGLEIKLGFISGPQAELLQESIGKINEHLAKVEDRILDLTSKKAKNQKAIRKRAASNP